MKIRCKCKNLAIWYYAPSSQGKLESQSYFCDNCVSRGCSCNWDEETQTDDKDEAGRLLPCVEYIFLEEGWDNDRPLDDSDKYSEYDDN